MRRVNRSIIIILFIAGCVTMTYKGQVIERGENMGRPSVPTHLKRGTRLIVLFTEDEKAALVRAAQAADAASLSDWARDVLLSAARDEGET